MKRVRDPRLHRWPRVFRGWGRLVLTGKVLSPWTLQLLITHLYKPLIFLWKATLAILILDGVFFAAKGYSFIDRGFWASGTQPPARWLFWAGLALFFVLWRLEKKSGHNFSRMVFGSRLRMVITQNRFCVGGWIPRLRVKRDLTLTFATQPIEGAKSEVFQESQQLMLVIDDSRSVKVASIYTLERARKVVENANMALRIGIEDDEVELDLDPSRTG